MPELLASDALIERSLRALLDDVAAATPAPGGGCAAAWSCALAAALVEMTARVTLQRPDHRPRHQRMREIAGRASTLRDRATSLGERELHSYQPVLEVLALPQDDPDRAARLDGALSDATQTPFALARVGGEIAALALEAARTASPLLRGDAIAALALAEAGCQAAAQLVTINLAGRPSDHRLAEVADIADRAASIRAEAI